MKIGVMQPYFFPYIGYWQLMNVVDKYVLFDDVNYINRGWINRNRILFNNEIRYFNLPMLGASQNKHINEILVNNSEKEIKRNIEIIKEAYGKAPYFETVFPMIKNILACGKETVSEYNLYLFEVLADYMQINTDFIISSKIEKRNDLKGENKIVEICKILNADTYVNAIGGKELYHSEVFKKNNMNLYFLNTKEITYKQFNDEFSPNLSIIDVLMFNSREEVIRMLDCYSLET